MFELRIRSSDGWALVEVRATNLLGDHRVRAIVVELRALDWRALEAKALAAMVAGDVASGLALLVEVVEAGIPDVACDIIHFIEPAWVGVPTPAIVASGRSPMQERYSSWDSSSAWHRAISSGRAVVAAASDWSESVSNAVTSSGYQMCSATPISYDRTPVGTIVVWARDSAPAPGPWQRRLLEQVSHVASLGLQRQQIQQLLQHAATTDRLTTLRNRQSLDDELGAEEPRWAAALFIDLDGFKAINDRHGHATGDAVLAAIGRRLSNAARTGDVVARYGGDEFVILCRKATRNDAEKLGRRLLAVVASPLTANGIVISPAASIGVARRTDHTECDAALLNRADLAAYQAKASGGMRLHTSTTGSDPQTRRASSIVSS